tara:strand:+ start:311 stop:598 length:288 start_codon:yes stop_codon:yes gene_type:complete
MTRAKLKVHVQKDRSLIVTHNKKAIEELLDAVGGVPTLANFLNLGYTTVNSWKERGRISKAGAKLVANHPLMGKYYKEEDLRLDLECKYNGEPKE